MRDAERFNFDSDERTLSTLYAVAYGGMNMSLGVIFNALNYYPNTFTIRDVTRLPSDEPNVGVVVHQCVDQGLVDHGEPGRYGVFNSYANEHLVQFAAAVNRIDARLLHNKLHLPEETIVERAVRMMNRAYNVAPDEDDPNIVGAFTGLHPHTVVHRGLLGLARMRRFPLDRTRQRLAATMRPTPPLGP